MSRKLRTTSTFSLSFLDIMSCGLGAAVLIFLILRHNVDAPTEVVPQKLLAEINLLEDEIKTGEDKLVRIRNTISEVSDEAVTARGLARKISQEIAQLQSLLEDINPDAVKNVEGMKEQLAKLQEQKKTLEKTKVAGNKAYQFTGDGQRQYLTGLKLGGDNILLLIDASASMLDETLVNIIRRRNMSDSAKRNAPKWQRVLAMTQWVLANIPLTSDFQVLVFNTQVKPALGADVDAWREVSDTAAIEATIKAMENVVPQQGTDMHAAFAAAMDMRPRPDNIYLITDGLPTVAGSNSGGTVSGLDRLKLFDDAMQLILPGIPVNTLLLPLEGDPYAASAFWRLAIVSRGAFVTPSRDWP